MQSWPLQPTPTFLLLFFVLNILPAYAQTGAACGVGCDNYNVNLENTDSIYDQNVLNIGGAFTDPTTTLDSMCRGSGTDIQTCQVCTQDGEGLTGSSATLLLTWWRTCVTFNEASYQDTYNCWLSIPGGGQSCPQDASSAGVTGGGGSNGSGMYERNWGLALLIGCLTVIALLA